MCQDSAGAVLLSLLSKYRHSRNQHRGGTHTTEELVKTDFWFEVELIVFKVGSIGLVVHGLSDDEARLKGERFMWGRRWKGKTGKVTKLNERSAVVFTWKKLG